VRQCSCSSLTRLVAAGLFLLFFTVPSFGANTRTLAGHVPLAARARQPKGRLVATQQLRLAIGLPLRNRDSLTELLRQIYDPADPNYHQYLTASQFASRFGPTPEDYLKVMDFARTNGLIITSTHPTAWCWTSRARWLISRKPLG